ncbi:ribokinase [Chelativorans sp. ZYF759]|uniref:ribokinase n=1 Tax=Chelativorans sp. ZYF759 TaxID=2692213 RepID=UPI00145F76B3|nr:ribokinase [Chelativorans sp. ZYF759]
MITVIGSINLDLIANVARLPEPGETVAGSTFSSAPGGKGANQALAASRAGGDVRMIGAVGQDSFADQALNLLRQAGIDLASVRDSHATTGTALILVAASGENVIAVIPGANATVLPGDVAAADLQPGEHVLLQHEIPAKTVRAALAAARERGAVSLLNTAPFLPESADTLGLADYVIANETEFDLYAEALALEGASRGDKMLAFAKRFTSTLIVTLGKDGAIATVDGELLRVSAPEITPVDTVGAGDTFCGYLAAALDSGLELEEAMCRATVAGSLACLKSGAQPSIPHATEVDEAMAG